MMLSKGKFLASVAGLLLIILALEGAIARATRASIPRQVLARAGQFTKATVLAIGNSLIAAGFDAAAFDRGMGLEGETGAVNLGLGASTVVEQLLLMRHALHQGMSPKLLVYGFFDFQLTTPISLATRDFIGNRSILYYLEPEYGLGFYDISTHDRIEFEVMRHSRMMVDRWSMWTKVEFLRRSMAEIGMPSQETNRFGRASDFSLLEAADTPAFVEECGRGERQDLVAAVKEMIRQAREAGMTVAFVEMPMHPTHLSRYYDTRAWDAYRGHMRDLLEAMGVIYVDAGRWIPDGELFDDALHLKKEGAERFSLMLGEKLRSDHPVPGP